MVEYLKIVFFFPLIFVFIDNSLAEPSCVTRNQIDNADWKNDVLDADRAVFLLEMELFNSLIKVDKCLDEISRQSNPDTHLPNSVSDNQPPNTSNLPQATKNRPAVDGKSKSASDERDEEYEIANRKRSNTSNNGKVLQPDAETTETLELVLLEAIQNETDPSKREALKARYKQMFGKDSG